MSGVAQQAMDDARDGRREGELCRWQGSGAFAESVTDYLGLAGIRIAPGDLNRALLALGLVLCLNAPDGSQQLPGNQEELLTWLTTTGPEAMTEPLTEEGRCPKCGLPRFRLRGEDTGWWHVKDNADWGYQRRCWHPEMIRQLPEDELRDRARFLEGKRRR